MSIQEGNSDPNVIARAGIPISVLAQDMIDNNLVAAPGDGGGASAPVPFGQLVALQIPTNAKVSGAVTVPVLTADERLTVTFTLPMLGYPDSALVAFFNGSAADADIQSLRIVPGSQATFRLAGPDSSSHPQNVGSIPFPGAGEYLMLVDTDYMDARRLTAATSTTFEKYGSGSGTAYPSDGTNQGLAYRDNSVGVLFGWYSIPGTGVLGLNKKVQMESAWLETDDSNTLLHVVLHNVDSSSSNTASVKAVVYE